MGTSCWHIDKFLRVEMNKNFNRMISFLFDLTYNDYFIPFFFSKESKKQPPPKNLYIIIIIYILYNFVFSHNLVYIYIFVCGVGW